MLRQGDLPRAERRASSRDDVGSILLGTESFWTGIDVAGEALTGLVIDKLPFRRPTTRSSTPSASATRAPSTTTSCRSPSSRCARASAPHPLQTDVGVAVILDKRIAEKGYGKKFLKSLPPMLTTRRVENITRFLEEAAYARAS